MKYKYLISFLLFFFCAAHQNTAQILNGDFETWALNHKLSPDPTKPYPGYWATFSDNNFEKSTSVLWEKVSGANGFAIQLFNKKILNPEPSPPDSIVISPYLRQSLPINGCPDSLSFYFKWEPGDASDKAFVYCLAQDIDTSGPVPESNTICSAQYVMSDSNPGWKYISVPFTTESTGMPNLITIYLWNNLEVENKHLNSKLSIDEISFYFDPLSVKDEENYIDLNKADHIIIYDLLGRIHYESTCDIVIPNHHLNEGIYIIQYFHKGNPIGKKKIYYQNRS